MWEGANERKSQRTHNTAQHNTKTLSEQKTDCATIELCAQKHWQYKYCDIPGDTHSRRDTTDNNTQKKKIEKSLQIE